jgi:stage IV sporulation protein B
VKTVLKNVKKLSVFSIFILLFASFMISSNAASNPIYVVPSGEAVGVKIHTDGLLVVGTTPEGKNSGIKTNDIIKSVNGTNVTSNEQLADIVNKYHDNLSFTIIRNNEEINIAAKPYQADDGIYKLGLWVRDSTAGIGTITYYNPQNNTFAALGHGICDVDTGNILTVKSGNILPCNILSVTKGENGNPGELNGSFDGEPIGEIMLNTDSGIYGNGSFDANAKALPVAEPSEVQEGNAYILADIDGGEVKKYDIEISKISHNKSGKNMVIEITDEQLLSLTGGIVQGMSGAPIIQNDKLVGAVTHVFVNNSAKGYGTFAENMINISENMN